MGITPQTIYKSIRAGKIDFIKNPNGQGRLLNSKSFQEFRKSYEKATTIPEGYTTAKELSKRLYITPQTITQRIRRGEIKANLIPHVKSGKLYIIPESEARRLENEMEMERSWSE